MKRLYYTVDQVYSHLAKDNDCVWAICGDEGKGKSRGIGLNLIQYWYDKYFDGCTEDDADRLTGNLIGFATQLLKSQSKDILGLDEGGKLSNRKTMHKLNVIIQESYQILRSENFFSLLFIPSIFDLDPFFARRRIKGLIQVFERGRFAYYNRTKIHQIVVLNENRKIKSTQVVKPVFYDTCPDYKGIMLKKYLKIKKETNEQQKQKLYDTIMEIEGIDKTNAKIKSMTNNGYQGKDIAEVLGITPSAVSQRKKKMRLSY